jgi:uncharacterized membrane protein (DUF485 family)
MADNTKWGLRLFWIYCVIYFGFILLNAYWPESMSLRIWGGVNVAIAYGMILILGAIILAVIYLYHAKNEEES